MDKWMDRWTDGYIHALGGQKKDTVKFLMRDIQLGSGEESENMKNLVCAIH